MAQTVKRLPTMRETWVRSLGREDALEKEMATHSSVLAWKILWAEEPGWLLSIQSQRVGHKWMTSLSLMILLYTCLHLTKLIYRASFGTSVLNCLSLSLLSNSAEMSVFRHMLSYFSIKSLQNHTSGYYISTFNFHYYPHWTMVTTESTFLKIYLRSVMHIELQSVFVKIRADMIHFYNGFISRIQSRLSLSSQNTKLG